MFRNHALELYFTGQSTNRHLGPHAGGDDAGPRVERGLEGLLDLT